MNRHLTTEPDEDPLHLIRQIWQVPHRSEEHTSELQSRETSYAVFGLKKKNVQHPGNIGGYSQLHPDPQERVAARPIEELAVFPVGRASDHLRRPNHRRQHLRACGTCTL